MHFFRENSCSSGSVTARNMFRVDFLSFFVRKKSKQVKQGTTRSEKLVKYEIFKKIVCFPGSVTVNTQFRAKFLNFFVVVDYSLAKEVQKLGKKSMQSKITLKLLTYAVFLRKIPALRDRSPAEIYLVLIVCQL
jgi:hypothetical protein